MALHLFRIAGIDVHADWSLLVIFALVTLSLALGVFPAWHPDWTPALTWSMALVAAVAFFASVLIHELSHAIVGRRHGAVIRRITLFVFGGMAHVEREPGQWRAELWMAAVGPLTSLLLGAVFFFWAGRFVEPAAFDPQAPLGLIGQLGPWPTVLLWLGQVNILLGLFNLVPGFPLDGGRVLRALLWAATGNLRKATRWAAYLGQAFAGLLIATGLLMLLGVRVPLFGVGLGGLWLAFIGWFLFSAAQMSYRQLLTRESLEGIPVSRLMARQFECASPRISVQALVDTHMLGSGQHAFPVVEDERLVGMVSLTDVKRLPQPARASTPLAQVMTPRERLGVLSPDTDAYEALRTMAERQVSHLPVLVQERLVGLLRREDLLGWLVLQQGDGAQRRPLPA